MIFEDAHWADSTSLELFSRVVERIAAVRVLLIVTFRPEFEPPWIGRPHVTALTINRLAQRDIDAMIDRVVGASFRRASLTGDVHIAYQAFGEGPINLVMVPGFVSNVENYWDEPDVHGQECPSWVVCHALIATKYGVIGRPACG